jgi:hypothetical protein
MSQREKHPTVHVQTVTVTDPDNGAPTQVEIRKDKVTGALVGIDGSYLEQDVGPVYDPYNPGVILDIPDDENGPAKPAQPAYEIARTLVLSTCHLTKADGNLLDQCESPLCPFEKKVGDDACGWWVCVPDPEDGFNSDAQILAAGYSQAFLGLIHLGRRLNCQWLMLDRDGPQRAELPQFHW